MKFHVPVGRGVERRLGSFQLLTSDSGYFSYTRINFNCTERTYMCPARLTVVAQVGISKLRAEGPPFALKTSSRFCQFALFSAALFQNAPATLAMSPRHKNGLVMHSRRTNEQANHQGIDGPHRPSVLAPEELPTILQDTWKINEVHGARVLRIQGSKERRGREGMIP
ncbi:hypothetical protein EVAR_96040_1 [Eumeta japonica]|uniref:Uncharacterized protein n=1 Tax=Eumeta variegata TaxID=151549 RepID=A0A4C1WAB9_EUMVA|nr:hypothetical protein EVAR_96040_1 [Eumeta japonica]